MNGVPMKERTPKEYIPWDQQSEREGQFGLSLILHRGLIDEVFSVSMQTRLQYAHQKDVISRAKYLELMPYRAILFHPAEMNIVYGAPSLRRACMDTTLQIALKDAYGVMREYDQALKSRNHLLKSIAQGSARMEDLDMWDQVFCDRAVRVGELRRTLADAWMPQA